MTFKNIQGLRAIAVLLVVVAHVHDFSDKFKPSSALSLLTELGSWGVDLFFVISGFIMVVVHWEDFAQPGSPQRFMLKRIVRIFPLYWVVTLVLLTALRLTPGLTHTWMGASANVPASLVLLPQEGGQLLFVAWTLTYEMYFYYVFAALLCLRRSLAMRAFALWAGVILALQLVPAIQNNTYGAVICGNLVLEFVMGAFVGAAIVRRRFVAPQWPLALGCLGLVVSYGVTLYSGPALTDGSLEFACVGLPMAAVVYGAVVLEIGARRIFPAALQSIGDASYSIYLWHALIFAALGKILLASHVAAKVPAAVLYVLPPIVVVALSVLLYRRLEVPLLEASRRLCAKLFPRVMRRRPAQPAVVPLPVR